MLPFWPPGATLVCHTSATPSSSGHWPRLMKELNTTSFAAFTSQWSCAGKEWRAGGGLWGREASFYYKCWQDRQAMLAIGPQRGDNGGEVWVSRNLSSALSPKIHMANTFISLVRVSCACSRREPNNTKLFDTRLSKLFVFTLAFDIELPWAIYGIMSWK